MTRNYNPNMIRQKKRLYDNEAEAVKSARTRAKSFYRTQFIYKNPETGQMQIRSKPIAGQQPYLKVRFDGTIERYEKESEI